MPPANTALVRCRFCWRPRRCGRAVRSLTGRMTRSISPRCIRCPAALSAIIWCDTFCCASSHAVRVAPGERGRVFVAVDVEFLPCACAAYIGAVAVPTSTNASQPALQCVRIFMPLRINFSPVPPDFLAMPHVFTGKFLGGGERERLLFRHGPAGAHRGANAVHGIDGIHGGGTRGFEHFINSFNSAGEISADRFRRKASAPWARP